MWTRSSLGCHNVRYSCRAVKSYVPNQNWGCKEKCLQLLWGTNTGETQQSRSSRSLGPITNSPTPVVTRFRDFVRCILTVQLYVLNQVGSKPMSGGGINWSYRKRQCFFVFVHFFFHLSRSSMRCMTVEPRTWPDLWFLVIIGNYNQISIQLSAHGCCALYIHKRMRQLWQWKENWQHPESWQSPLLSRLSPRREISYTRAEILKPSITLLMSFSSEKRERVWSSDSPFFPLWNLHMFCSGRHVWGKASCHCSRSLWTFLDVSVHCLSLECWLDVAHLLELPSYKEGSILDLCRQMWWNI